jgi:hypothetical protein
MAQRYNEVLRTAAKEALSKGLSRSDVDVFVSKQLQSAVLEEKKYFEDHGKWSYGATGTAERVADAVKKVFGTTREGKEEDSGQTNTDSDSMLD